MGPKERAAWMIALFSLVIITAAVTVAMLAPETIQKLKLPTLTFNHEKNEDKAYQKIRLAHDALDYRFTEMVVNYLGDFPQGKYSAPVKGLAAEHFYRMKKKEEARLWLNRAVGTAEGEALARPLLARLIGQFMLEDDVYDPVYTRFLENSYLALSGNDQREMAGYLGYAYLFAGDQTNALRYFNLGAGETAIVGKARLYILQGHYPDAFREYENYLTLYPQGNHQNSIRNAYLKQAAYYTGWLIQAKRNPEALAVMEMTVRRFQNDTNAAAYILQAGVSANELKQTHAAESYLTIAARQLPVSEKPKALLALALVSYQAGDKLKARERLENLKSSYPQAAESAQADEWLKLLEKEARYGR